MKRYTYLGINGNRCCILESLASPTQIIESVSDLRASDFTHDCTDWCGNDAIERTCKIKKYNRSGQIIQLINPITFYGTDYDMGHEYSWDFVVKQLEPVEAIP